MELRIYYCVADSLHRSALPWCHLIQCPAEIPDDFAKQLSVERWRGEFVLERSTSEIQSISVAKERWSVEHRAFAVKTYLKNNDSVLTQRIFRRHFKIHRNECP
jgi:hypothetical protein